MGLKGSYICTLTVLHPKLKIQRVCDDISERRTMLRKRFKRIRPRDSGSQAMCRQAPVIWEIVGQKGYGESSVHVEVYSLL